MNGYFITGCLINFLNVSLLSVSVRILPLEQFGQFPLLAFIVSPHFMHVETNCI